MKYRLFYAIGALVVLFCGAWMAHLIYAGLTRETPWTLGCVLWNGFVGGWMMREVIL